MARPVGRPPKLTDKERSEVFTAFSSYIKDTEDPTVAGFLSNDDIPIQYNVTRDNLNDWEEFSTLIKRAVVKQESYLLKLAGSGKYNPALAIFRLKQPQHGYKDKIEQENSGEQKLIIETRKYGGEPETDANTDD